MLTFQSADFVIHGMSDFLTHNLDCYPNSNYMYTVLQVFCNHSNQLLMK